MVSSPTAAGGAGAAERRADYIVYVPLHDIMCSKVAPAVEGVPPLPPHCYERGSLRGGIIPLRSTSNEINNLRQHQCQIIS